MMTMIATVLGGVPLVLAARRRRRGAQALGWIIVGGLGFATVSTLFLTPVAYRCWRRFSKPRAAETQKLIDELKVAPRTARATA